MKKILFIVLSSLLLTGCGAANKVVCSATEEFEEGVNATISLIADMKDEKVDKLTAEFKFENEETAKKYCEQYQVLANEEDSGINKDSFTCSKDTITFNDYSALAGDSEKELIGLSKDEFISKNQETEGVTCK